MTILSIEQGARN